MMTKRTFIYDEVLQDVGPSLLVTAVILAVIGIAYILVRLRRRTRRINNDRSDHTPQDGHPGAGTSRE